MANSLRLTRVCDGLYYKKQQHNVTALLDGTFTRDNSDELIISAPTRDFSINARMIGAIPVPAADYEPKIIQYNNNHLIAIGCKIHLFKVSPTGVTVAKEPLDITGEVTGKPRDGHGNPPLWCVNGTKIASLANWKVCDIGLNFTEVITGSAIFICRSGADINVLFGSEPDPVPMCFENCEWLLTPIVDEYRPLYEMVFINRATSGVTKFVFDSAGKLEKSLSASLAELNLGESTASSRYTHESAHTYSHAYGVGGTPSAHPRARAPTHVPTIATTPGLKIIKHTSHVADGLFYLKVETPSGEYAGVWSVYEQLSGMNIASAVNKAVYNVNGFSIKLEYVDGTPTLAVANGGYKNKSRPILLGIKFTSSMDLNGFYLSCEYNGRTYKCSRLRTDTQTDVDVHGAMCAVEMGDPVYTIETSMVSGEINVDVTRGGIGRTFSLTTSP